MCASSFDLTSALVVRTYGREDTLRGVGASAVELAKVAVTFEDECENGFRESYG